MLMLSDQPADENDLSAGSQRFFAKRAFRDAFLPTPTWDWAPGAALLDVASEA